jgi:uncharacterized protein
MYSKYQGPVKLIIGKSKIPGAGYGVFAKSSIRKGELLEICPFVEVHKDMIYDQSNILQNYVFKSHCNPKGALVVFGYGSIFNHSKTPNVFYSINGRDQNRLLDFIALKDVSAGTELCTFYAPKHSANQ